MRKSKWIMAGVLLALAMPGWSQEKPDELKETYRLRVENQSLGRVEVSIDGGAHYLLLGRVSKPATKSFANRAVTEKGTVLKSDSDGIVFGVAQGQVMKILPGPPSLTEENRGKAGTHSAAPKSPGMVTVEPWAILTNLEPHRGLFNDLLPPRSTTRVGLQSPGGTPLPLPLSHTANEEDVFLFQVSLPEAVANVQAKGFAHKRLLALTKTYQERAVERAKANKRQVVSGILNLKATLPEGEPDPIVYISYILDGETLATQNTKPFRYGWDTTQSPDGEYAVEIRGLNRSGRTLTRVRTLVVVQNKPPTSAEPGKTSMR